MTGLEVDPPPLPAAVPPVVVLPAAAVPLADAVTLEEGLLLAPQPAQKKNRNHGRRNRFTHAHVILVVFYFASPFPGFSVKCRRHRHHRPGAVTTHPPIVKVRLGSDDGLRRTVIRHRSGCNKRRIAGQLIARSGFLDPGAGEGCLVPWRSRCVLARRSWGGACRPRSSAAYPFRTSEDVFGPLKTQKPRSHAGLGAFPDVIGHPRMIIWLETRTRNKYLNI